MPLEKASSETISVSPSTKKDSSPDSSESQIQNASAKEIPTKDRQGKNSSSKNSAQGSITENQSALGSANLGSSTTAPSSNLRVEVGVEGDENLTQHTISTTGEDSGETSVLSPETETIERDIEKAQTGNTESETESVTTPRSGGWTDRWGGSRMNSHWQAFKSKNPNTVQQVTQTPKPKSLYWSLPPPFGSSAVILTSEICLSW